MQERNFCSRWKIKWCNSRNSYSRWKNKQCSSRRWKMQVMEKKIIQVLMATVNQPSRSRLTDVQWCVAGKKNTCCLFSSFLAAEQLWLQPSRCYFCCAMFQLDRTQFKTVRELSWVFGQGDNWSVYKGGKTMTGKASVIKKKQVLRPTAKKIWCREEHAGFDGCGKGYYRICKEITHTILARSNHRK